MLTCIACICLKNEFWRGMVLKKEILFIRTFK
jgi:hypothetical protein